MDNIVENDCNYYTNGTFYFNHDKDCGQGQREFNEDVKEIQPLRHEYGTAILSGNYSKKADAIEKKLEIVTAKLNNKYNDKVDECFDEYDDSACGYIFAFDHYVASLGPTDSLKQSYKTPRNLPLKPLNNGFLVFDFDNGEHYEGLFDTGAEATAFTTSLYKLASKYFTFFFNVKDSTDKAYIVNNMGLRFANDEFAPKLSLVTSNIEIHYQGFEDDHLLMSFIGTDYLIGNAFEVDYDKSTMIFDFNVEKRVQEGNWHQVPLSLEQSELYGYLLSLDVYVNGVGLRMLFDTGADATVVFDKCALPFDELNKTDSTSYSIYGNNEGELVEATIDFGSKQLIKRILLDSPDSKLQKVLGATECGVLGVDVLRHFDYIYDPNSLSLYVKKREIPPNYDDNFYLGAKLKMKKKGALIECIEYESLLAKAGLKKGDVIVKIADTNIRDSLGKLGLMNLLTRSENNVPIKYKRKGKIYKGLLRKE